MAILSLKMVKQHIADETKEDKFKRIAEARVNKLLKQFSTLRNCANHRVYSYNDLEVNKIFKALEEELKLTRQFFVNNKGKSRGIKL